MNKKIAIITVAGVISIAFWITVMPWLESQVKFADPSVWVLPLIMLVLLSATLSLSFILLTRTAHKLLLSAFNGVIILILFGIHWLLLVAIGIMIISHLWAIRDINLELKERNKIHIGQTAGRGKAYILFPLLLALSFAYYLSPGIQEKAENTVPITFRQAITSTVEKFLESTPDDEVITNEVREEATNRSVNLIFNFIELYQNYLPPLLAFGLFIILWGISFVLTRFSIWISRLIFWTLRRLSFVSIEHADVKAEVIRLV